MSRHVAEALLLSNGIEGTYLMRRSPNDPARFAVSVKTHAAVVHFQVRASNHPADSAREGGRPLADGQRRSLRPSLALALPTQPPPPRRWRQRRGRAACSTCSASGLLRRWPTLSFISVTCPP